MGNGRVAQWVKALKTNRKVQTPLGAQPSIVFHLHYEAPGDLQVEN